ncbi:MAG: glutathione peroxidase [Bacilli bacterium]|nr:glutathione peroxidase [Bacilli bacterium]
MSTIYDYTVKNQQNQDVNLSEYQGKVVLIVNTATGCGFTPQYEGLQKLYDTYKDQGFVILDFPCNQFFGQAPGTDEEIHSFCTLKYNVSFPQFHKIDVNGKNADPLYVFLKSQKKGRIKWNFSKFLINRKGEVVARYGSMAKPESFEKDIQDELAK